MDTETKIKEVIDKEIKPALAMEGGSVEFLGLEDGVVKVALLGACGGCPLSQMTLKNFVETTIKQRVPDVKKVVASNDFF
ncbi:MAG: NifU family protein [Candidatus Methanoliparum thermophilum]|uniref:NifU family protein n=1 Tax=Methanoliparum thermophilum TaxID=2491083 RepID=A0A520KRV0_METT2|nr:NifU family protein [Candidatus Methanoliparum sp. LAM-1]RZN64516.1 MAG: NifU family protein [Candidatus Methanoliparum thermophilum]BDC35888.1 NifU family protein [Candidatus Methanoliparum sp. LAM-1]